MTTIVRDWLRLEWSGWRRSVNLISFFYGGVLLFVPLFNLLGYEFSLAVAIYASLMSFPVAVLAMREAVGGPIGQYLQLTRRAFRLLLIPLALVSLGALWVTNCSYGLGLAFYLVIAGGALLWSLFVALLSLWLGRGRIWLSGGLYYALFLGSLLGFGLYLALEPPIVGVNPYFGYFAGSIYDEALAIPVPLLAYRSLQLLLLGGGLLALELRYRWVDPVWRMPLGVGSLALISLAMTGHAFHEDIGYSLTRGFIAKELGGQLESEHFVMVHRSGREWARRAEWLLEDHEFRYWQLAEFFDEEPELPVVSFVYPDRDTKGRLMGARSTLVAKLWLGEMHLLLDSYGDSVLKHELAHVFSAPFGAGPLNLSVSNGVFPNMGLVEGLATAAQWDSGELSPHGWSAALFELELAPSTAAIMGAAGFWGQHSRTVYILMGSFCRWLIDTRGIEAFKAVYGEGDFEKVYGESMANLVDAWRAFLATEVELSPAELELARYHFDRPSIFGKVCARSAASRRMAARKLLGYGRWAEAQAELEAVVADDPDNPIYQQELMKALFEGRKLEAARAIGEGLLEMELGRARQSEVEAVLGDIAWMQGELEASRRYYRAVVGMEGIPPESHRRVLLRLAAVEGSRLEQELIRQVLFEGYNASQKLLLTEEGWLAEPDSWLFAYLHGVLAFSKQGWSTSRRAMQEVLNSCPWAELREHAHWILGQSCYFLLDLDCSRVEMAYLAKEARYEGARVRAADWVERCDWKQSQMKSQ